MGKGELRILGCAFFRSARRRHPSSTPFSAISGFLEGFILLAYSQIRIWKTPVLKQHPGSLVGEFLVGYSILRIIGEQFREPDAALTLGMSRGTTLSVLMAIVGLTTLLEARKRSSAESS